MENKVDSNEALNQNEENEELQLPVEPDYRTLFSEAMHQYEIHEYEEASKCFLKIYEYFPEQIEALVNYGNCQYELLNTEEAVKYWKIAKEKDKYLINPYVNLGKYALGSSHFD